MTINKFFPVDADEREAWTQEEQLYWDNERKLMEREMEYDTNYDEDPFLSDGEADADALASVGWGTDEDYGGFDSLDY